MTQVLEFLTHQEFVDRIKNPHKYASSGNKSPAFIYLESLLQELCAKIQKFLQPDLSQKEWDKEFKVSISPLPKQPEMVALKIPDTEPVHLLYIDAAETAANEIEGLLEIYFGDDPRIEKKQEYQDMLPYLEALQNLSPM